MTDTSGALGPGFSLYGGTANAVADQYGIPRNIFASLIQQESSFNSAATQYNTSSGTTDYGLGQLNSGSFPGAQSLTPEQNLDASGAYLSGLYKKYGNDWSKALSAYNSGSPSAATQYASDVMTRASNINPTLLSQTAPSLLGAIGQTGIDIANAVAKALQPAVNATSDAVTGAVGDAATSATNAATSAVQSFITTHAAAIVFVLVGGALIVFALSSAVKGAAPPIIVQAMKAAA